jgi:hypothetical protein
LFRRIHSNAHQYILLHVKLLNIHYHLLIVKFFISEVNLALFNIKPELFLYSHLFNILHLSVLRYKERVEAAVSGGLLMRRLLLIHLGVKRMDEEDADQDILRVKSLPLLLLLKLLF